MGNYPIFPANWVHDRFILCKNGSIHLYLASLEYCRIGYFNGFVSRYSGQVMQLDRQFWFANLLSKLITNSGSV